MWLFNNLKSRIFRSIITWSERGNMLPKLKRFILLQWMRWLHFHYSLQAAHRTYCNPAKGTSESYKDLKDKPIRFSTSKARRLTLNQTLGDMNEKTSNRPIYIGFITMVILTYIIFFLPASKEEVEEWELLEDAEISKQQDIKRQWQESDIC